MKILVEYEGYNQALDAEIVKAAGKDYCGGGYFIATRTRDLEFNIPETESDAAIQRIEQIPGVRVTHIPDNLGI